MIFEKFTKLLVVIFTLGLLEYVCIQLNLAHKIGTALHSDKEGLVDSLGTFEVYLFNLKPVYIFGIHRFQSIFDEPGVVGTLSAFYIFSLDPKKYRYSYCIFLISGVVSFSLAFYILFLVRIVLSRNFIWNILITSGIAFTIYNLFFEGLDVFIISRISDTENINNRSTDYFDKLFDRFIHTNDAFLGKGVGYSSLIGEGVSTWKVIVFDYGFLGLISIIGIMVFLIYKLNSSRNDALLLVIVFCLSFYQRPNINYIPTIIILIGNISTNRLINKKTENHVSFGT